MHVFPLAPFSWYLSGLFFRLLLFFVLLVLDLFPAFAVPALSPSRFSSSFLVVVLVSPLVAQGSGIPPEDVHNWVSREVDHFFESCAIPLFASAFLSLSPFLAEGYEILPGTAERGSIHKWHGLPGSHVYVETFM